jgi:deoxyadenosine/deoxycytidine kinase
MRGKILGIAGATGSGKTTLVSQLLDRHNAIPIYEEWENNPYLNDFCNSKNLLKNQMWFIKNDIDRMQRAIDLSLNGQMIAIDKIFIQNYTFVSITNFSDTEMKICFDLLDKYLHLSNHFDLIVNISIDEKEILRRIKKRNRDVELNLNIKWFQNFQKSQKDYLCTFQEKFHFQLIEYNNTQKTFEEINSQIKRVIYE